MTLQTGQRFGRAPFNQHIAMASEARAGLNECIQRQAHRLLAEEGLDAFAMPKSAALAHECGHCIVGTHEGLTVVEVKVFERGTGIWCGITNETSPWHINADTPTEAALSRARYLIAGAVGEAVLDPDNFRSGSSLDEIVLTQMLLGGLWTERREEFADFNHPEDLWKTVYRQTCCIVKFNEAVGHDLIRKLKRNGRLYGKPLAASLRRVAQFVFEQAEEKTYD